MNCLGLFCPRQRVFCHVVLVTSACPWSPVAWIVRIICVWLWTKAFAKSMHWKGGFASIHSSGIHHNRAFILLHECALRRFTENQRRLLACEMSDSSSRFNKTTRVYFEAEEWQSPYKSLVRFNSVLFRSGMFQLWHQIRLEISDSERTNAVSYRKESSDPTHVTYVCRTNGLLLF